MVISANIRGSSDIGVIDIGHFKAINDSYGHIYGDEVLILVARLLESSIRDYDLAFRFGGEEFVILMQAFDGDDAEYAFDRMRIKMSEHGFAKIEPLTVSIGVAQISHQMGSAEVIDQADKALYYAKENNRDRSCIYESLISQQRIKGKDIEIFNISS